jgi:maleylacetoacetate isomerase
MASTSTTKEPNTSPYTLITYFRSSCSARVRIALHLKSLPYTPVYINLLKGEQHSASNLAFNPSHSVPTLIPSSPSTEGFHITQSLAALEYLDELHPSPALLPEDPKKRAAVRALASIIACDTQPVTNLRILERIGNLTSGSAEEKAAARARWAKELMTDGLAAYESVAKGVAGKYSVGDEVSMADLCLVPAVWGAERFGVDLSLFPTVVRICRNMAGLEAVERAHWKSQGDTPESLRC